MYISDCLAYENIEVKVEVMEDHINLAVRSVKNDYAVSLTLSGPQVAVITALKPADDGNGGVVRFWNPTNGDVVDGFRTAAPLDKAFLCNLNEEPGAELPVRDGAVPVAVPAGGLATVRFTWKTTG